MPQQLDASIYGQLKTPGELSAEQDLASERAARVQALQQQQRDRQAVQTAFQQFTDPQTGQPDIPKVLGALYRTAPAAAESLSKSWTDQREKLAQSAKVQTDTDLAKSKLLGSIASSITDQATLNAAREAYTPEIARTLPEVYDEQAKSRLKQLEQAGLDGQERVQRAHNGFMELLDLAKFDADAPERLVKTSRAAAEVYANLGNDEDRQAFLKAAPTLGVPPQVVAMLTGKTAYEAGQMAMSLKERADLALGQQREQREAQNNITQNQHWTSDFGLRQQELALRKQAEGRLEASAAAASAPPKPIEVGTPDYKVAQDLAFGRMTPAFFRTLQAYNRDAGKKAALYAKAAELNPNFNEADFERGFKFIANPQTGRQLSALDNALSGIPSLLEASDAAKRSGATILNSYTNPVKVAFGSQTFSNLRAARLAWADEVSGALGFGTATDMKLQLGLDLTDASLGPDNFRSAIQTVVAPFLERKKVNLLKQASVYGTPDNNSSLTPAGGPKEGDTKPITSPGYPPGATQQFRGGKWIRIK